MSRPWCGIFIGGAARRMGGFPKGRLPVAGSGQPIVLHLAALAQSLDLPVVLVGEHAAYHDLGLPFVPDQPAGIGPLGGLAALLTAASGSEVIALACDMPFVSAQILTRLLAVDLREADVVAVQTSPEAPLESFLARYRPTVLAPLTQAIAHGERSLQRLLRSLRVVALPLSEAEQAVRKDWDRWEEVPESLRPAGWNHQPK